MWIDLIGAGGVVVGGGGVSSGRRMWLLATPGSQRAGT
jgi:hypothetical protein